MFTKAFESARKATEDSGGNRQMLVGANQK